MQQGGGGICGDCCNCCQQQYYRNCSTSLLHVYIIFAAAGNSKPVELLQSTAHQHQHHHHHHHHHHDPPPPSTSHLTHVHMTLNPIPIRHRPKLEQLSPGKRAHERDPHVIPRLFSELPKRRATVRFLKHFEEAPFSEGHANAAAAE